MVSNIILELNFLPSLNLTGVDIVELFWSQISWSEAVLWYTELNADPYTSLQRLPLGISIKIALIEIIASAWGTSIWGGTRLHFLSSPLHHPLHTFFFPSPQSPHDTKRPLQRGEPLYCTSSRLIAHSEDPDIDKPYQPPAGHVLGASKWFFSLFILSIFCYSGVILISKCYNSLLSWILFPCTGRWYDNSWRWGWKWKNSCWEFWTVIKLGRRNRTTSTSFISCLWWVRIINRSFILLPCIGCSILHCFRKFSIPYHRIFLLGLHV